MDLFEASGTSAAGIPEVGQGAPLAVRMRPTSLDEVVGQDKALAPGAPLRSLIEPAGQAVPTSVILWGPPGTGKTTLAYLVARTSGRQFVELSAVSAGVKDIRDVVAGAKRHLVTSGQESVLFVDEIHRFSRTQQDALLPAVENSWVILIGATTENPTFSVIAPLLSRSLLVTLEPLDDAGISLLLDRAVGAPRGLGGAVGLDADAKSHIVRLAGGDARRALTILQAAASGALTSRAGESDTVIEPSDVAEAVQAAAVRYDRTGDQHYDVASAFIKSMRGSDVDAALHYLARMLEAGEDPRFIARRVMIAASEEVGMADPSALRTAVAAAQAVAMIGMPEARIILAQAVVHVATAPKSNAAYLAIDAAIADVREGNIGQVPPALRSTAVARRGATDEYHYAHDYPHAVVAQRYLPERLAGARYYAPSDRGFEAEVSRRLERIRAILHGPDGGDGAGEGTGESPTGTR